MLEIFDSSIHMSILTLPMLRLLIRPEHKNAKTFESHLNLVMLVFNV